MQKAFQVAPPSSLDRCLQIKYFTDLPPEKPQKKLRENLRASPQDLYQVIVAGASNQEWVKNTGSLLKRLFKDANSLMIEKKLEVREIKNILPLFYQQTDIHRDIIIRDDKGAFAASTSVLVGFSDYFESLFLGKFKQNRTSQLAMTKLSETDKPRPTYLASDIAMELSLVQLEGLYVYAETGKTDHLSDLTEPDLWSIIKFCHMVSKPKSETSILKAKVERILISKIRDTIAALESLNGCDKYELSELRSHCLNLFSEEKLFFGSREDGTLRASIYKGLKDQGVQTLSDLTNELTKINVTDSSLNQAEVADLVPRLTRLESVHLLVSNRGISQTAQNVIESCSNVHSLKITPDRHSVDTSVPMVYEDGKKVLSNILQLDLQHLPEKFKRFALGFIKSTTPMDIRFQACKWVDNDFIAGICHKFAPPLRLLDIGNCPKLTDEAAGVIARSFPMLVVLNIGHTHITSDGLILILRMCEQLRDVNATNCLLKEGMIRSQPELFARLTRLKLQGINRLSEADFKALVEISESMTELILDRCEHFKVRLLETARMPVLRKLTINERAFSDPVEKDVFLNLRFPSLEELIITGNPPSLFKDELAKDVSRNRKLKLTFINDQY